MQNDVERHVKLDLFIGEEAPTPKHEALAGEGELSM
jgi:hypothetical protein